MIDLGWRWTANTHFDPQKKRLLHGAHCTHLNEDRLILSAAKILANDSSFWTYTVYADSREGSSGWGHQMTVGLSMTAIFGDLGGYFFRNFKYHKASNSIWRYATPCWPVIDWKVDDLEWPWVAILLYSILKNNCVKSNKHRPMLSAAAM